MKSVFIAFAAGAICTSSFVLAQQSKPAAPAPSAAELDYDTFCKKTQQEKRALFRAATPAQKAVIARTQMERFRDANRARLNKEQLTLLAEFLALLTPTVFEDNKEAQAKLEALSDRVENAFSNEDQDAMDRDGPCFPKVAKD
jgi:hypothetical protein